MSSSVFDRIFASAPLNKTAAAVTSGGESYEDAPLPVAHWKAPPITRGPTVEEAITPSFRNLAGVQFGRFRVLGIHMGAKGKHSPQTWVVRCACGDYELRTARAICNPLNTEDRCGLCRRLEALRYRERQKAVGAVPSVTVEDALANINKGRTP